MREQTPFEALVIYAKDMNDHHARYTADYATEVNVMIERAKLYVEKLEHEAEWTILQR